MLTHFDRSKMVPALAVRNTAGVILPLVVGFALGMPLGGLAMASGALNVSYSDGHDPYQQRAKRMLASTVWCAIAIFLGAITDHRNIEAVFVATAWAFIAGMLVAVGTTAADVGVISLGFARRLCGAAFDGAASGPSRSTGAVRRLAANGAFDRAVAGAAAHTGAASAGRSVSGACGHGEQADTSGERPADTGGNNDAQEAIAALGSDNSIEGLRLRALLSQAERIRLSMMMLSRLRLRMEREAPGHAAIEAVGRYLENASSILAIDR